MPYGVKDFKKLISELTEKRWSGGMVITIEGEKEPKIAMRYLQPDYYNNCNYKIENDEKLKNFKYGKNIKVIDFPFYCTFSEDVVRHYFLQDLFDGDRIKLKNAMKILKYKEANYECYDEKEHKRIPGWYTSNKRIHTFTKDGIEEFQKELYSFPKEIYNQVTYSILIDYWKNREKTKTLKEYEDKLKKESNNNIWRDLISGFEIE